MCIPEWPPKCKQTPWNSTFFADDSNFFSSNKLSKTLGHIVNTELKKIKDYFDSNGLSINTTKTTYIHINPKHTKKTNIEIKLGDTYLQESSQLTFLGIIIDNKLKFQGHYKKVYDKVKNGLNGLIISKNKLNYRAKLNIYHSLIHSHLNYGALTWINNLNKQQLKSLTTIQKKAIRIVHNARYNAHTSALFYKSKITKVENIFEKECLLLIYKYKNKMLPPETQKIIDESLQPTTLGLRSETNIDLLPKRELKPGDTMYEILNNWNKHRTSIERISKIGELKYKINEIQNVITECNKVNCYVCNN